MIETVSNIGWSILFSFIGGLVGIALVMMASAVIPKLMDRLTPNIDEEKEIARGNNAVAEYYGRIVSACIIGVSIVIGAAVLGGVISALH
jgi:ABC-type antimicrobial peptide transport system permease subunit